MFCTIVLCFSPWSPGEPQTLASAAPKLIRREAQPMGQSLYVDIALGSESPAPPMTGIFVPAGYKARGKIDLILYLHGFLKYGGPDTDSPIDRLWDRQLFPSGAFREGVNESGKNVILVVPTLGPKSQAGRLERPGGFDAYLNEVIAALVEYGPYKGTGQPPPIGNIVIACHSGGGRPMLQIALNNDSYTAKVKECWGFDCLYSGRNRENGQKYFTQPQDWMRWAKSNKDKRLFVYYSDSTAQESQYLERNSKILGNVFVQESWAQASDFRGKQISPHGMIPMTHWRERLQQARFLLDK